MIRSVSCRHPLDVAYVACTLILALSRTLSSVVGQFCTDLTEEFGVCSHQEETKVSQIVPQGREGLHQGDKVAAKAEHACCHVVGMPDADWHLQTCTGSFLVIDRIGSLRKSHCFRRCNNEDNMLTRTGDLTSTLQLWRHTIRVATYNGTV